MTCLAPACPRPRLELGPWAMLCVPHALSMAVLEPVASAVPVRSLVDLRGRCWGQALACPTPATSVTAHGTWCLTHAPAQPTPAELVEDDDAELALAVLVATAGLGARIDSTRANLWASRAYGDTSGTETMAVRWPSTSSRAVTVALDDERVPRTARGMAKAARGWSVRLRAVDEPASLVLRAWRGPYLVVASWTGGSFASAWLQHSRGMPFALGARQASALLKAAP